MIDRKYISGVKNGKLEIPKDSVRAMIHASSIDKIIENNGQEIDIGPFVQEPFLGRSFPDDIKIGRVFGFGPITNAYGTKVIHTGTDIWPETNSKYPETAGMPVIPLAGIGVKALRYQIGYVAFFFNPKTGYFTGNLHVSPTAEINGATKSIGEIVGRDASGVVLNISKEGTKVPHLHLFVLALDKGFEDYSLEDI
jgi:hypothetical protein